MSELKAPFPYFGGKSGIASEVWAALGSPDHYIEPFFGSGAVLLLRPNWNADMTETVCDKDGMVCNAWRGIQFAPEEVAKWCDWPVNHADLMARKRALIREEDRLLEHLIADDKWFDPVMAGYWIWAASCWIGAGLNAQNAIPEISGKSSGIHARNVDVRGWFRRLQERLRNVRVVCGDWSRVCGGNWQEAMGTCGMFFDPPYGEKADRDPNMYRQESLTVAYDVQKWVLERGQNPAYRIVLAGYYEEHEELLKHGWRSKRWKAGMGWAAIGGPEDGTDKENRKRETLFLSPHCVDEFELFEGAVTGSITE